MMEVSVGLTKDNEEVVMMGEGLVNVRNDEDNVVMIKDRGFNEMEDEEEIDEVEDDKGDVVMDGKKTSG